jgi:hypothetical protein
MRELFRRLKWSDCAMILLVAFFLVALNTVYTIYYKANASAGFYYNWKEIYASEDTYVYYGYINQAISGRVLFENLYTNDYLPPVFNLFWFCLGRIARLFSLSAIAVYQLSKVFFIFLFLVVSYLFSLFLFQDKTKARLNFFTIVFATGFEGFLLPWIYIYILITKNSVASLDSIPEGAAFWTLLYSPHLIFALTLFISIIFFTLLAISGKKIKYSVCAGFCGLVLFQYHPFPLVTIGASFLLYAGYLYVKQRVDFFLFLKHTIIFFILSAQSIIYSVWTMVHNQWWRNMTILALPTPNIFLLILTFAPFIYFGLWSLKSDEKFRGSRYIFFLIISIVVAAYFPGAIQQRRLLEGLQIMFAPFVVCGLLYWLKNRGITDAIRPIVFMAVFPVLFLSTNAVYLYVRFVKDYDNRTANVYSKQELPDIFIWIAQNSHPEDTILVPPEIGDMVAAQTLRKVYVGHVVETPNYFSKVAQIKNFFINSNSTERALFLSKNNIKLILIDKNNQNYLQQMFFADKVYEQGDFLIYRVNL